MIQYFYNLNQNQVKIELPYLHECDRGWYGNPEPNTRNFVIQNLKEDSVVLDCGAQIGLYSILFSKICTKGKVFCFEPTETFELLSNNCKHNNCENITLIKKPLSNKVGLNKDIIYKIWSQQVTEEKEFDFETIDNFVEKNQLLVDFIKIDVDSYDYEVLLGSKNTLLNQSPTVLVELNYALEKRGYQVKDAIDFMQSIGYSVSNIIDNENYVFNKV
jgi:FkbM family methyltransferase